jgi:ketosteroid isomerase-like protein
MIAELQPSAADLARALLDAFAGKDREAAESLIAADFHFTSPLDNRIDRKAYFEICWPNSRNIDGFDIVHLFERDGQAAVTYVGRTIDGRRFRNTEVMTCRNGQIVEVDVYFGWSIPHEVEPGTHSDPE